ncbi:MAG: ionic transporter y4hA, partial [Aestuariivirgaceae bacterium]
YSFDPSPLGIAFAVLLIPVLGGAVFAAVHHAEVIAHRTGEPYGTLVLTIAVTVIELALIASVMLSEDGSPTLARDTVYAVVMIICTGVVGLCLFIGGLHHGEQSFRVTGASVYLAVLIALSALTLLLPNYTSTVPGPVYSASQLAFVSTVTLALYGVFLYIQTVRHREYFVEKSSSDGMHLPSNRDVALSFLLLLVSLVGVILLAKKFAAVVEAGTEAIGAPEPVVGVIVALLILLPESVAAVQSARRDELQKSINLALGSSLATIGMTVPAVAAMSMILGQQLVLGLDGKAILLLNVTLLISVLTFGTGRTNILYGFIHLVIFGTFLFLTFVP